MRNTYQQLKNALPRLMFFQRLQWKLTLTYTLVTVTAIVALQAAVYVIVLALLLSYFRSPQFPPQVAQTLQTATPQFRPHLAAGNSATLTLLLRQFRFSADLAIDTRGRNIRFGHNFQGSDDARDFLDDRVVALCLTDADGKLLAATGADALPVGTNMVEHWPAVSRSLLLATRRGAVDPAQLIGKTSDDVLLVVAPIFDDATGSVLGLLWARMNVSLDWDLLLGALSELFYPLLWLPLVGLMIGLAFGYVAARRLTQRFNGIAQAARQWEQGDFRPRAPEQPIDELGKLGEQLNQMAAKLQQQIALQQQLAAIEERNRLARELHDTVKQQLFACAMQISAAQRVLNANPTAVSTYLKESAVLAAQMQQELTAVIQELSPLPQSPANGLRSLAAEWSRQTGIAIELQNLEALPVNASPALNLALTRITQEALANIARHSRATRVALQVARNCSTTNLAVCDNGQGFDSALPTTGMGLQSMRQRALALPGGRFELSSAPDSGVCIRVYFDSEPTEHGNES